MHQQVLTGEASLAEEIVGILRIRIITGEYAMGEKLVENKIATELKVSRTPVRDAFKQLTKERLVEYIPNKGCFARGFTEDDMRDIYAVREAVEQLAVEWAINNRTEEDIAKLREQLEIMSVYTAKKMSDKLLQANEDFNNIIYQMTESRFIVQALKSYQEYIQLARKGILSKEENLQGIYDEHVNIYEAIAAGDVELAKAEVRKHLEESSKRATQKWLEVKNQEKEMRNV
ncbi:MAG: GntR family transcriptional regulator [Bacillota bacterium]|nr:GntR family transcriptional regulator [Bacillota bacterium]